MAILLVNAGKAILANRILGSGTEPKFIGWGTSSTAEAVSQTDLQTASSEARTSGTSSRVTTSVTNDTYQVVGTVTSTQTQTIQEVALFDASTSGNMLLRWVHGATALVSNEAIQYTLKVQF